jgi:transcription elongation factor
MRWSFSQKSLEFLASELRKFFKVGDHIKVVAPSSTYRDETGIL